MKKINDLKVEKTFYKLEKDVEENSSRQPYKRSVDRPPELVTSAARFGYFLLDIV